MKLTVLIFEGSGEQMSPVLREVLAGFPAPDADPTFDDSRYQKTASEIIARVEDDAFNAAFCAQFGHAATATNCGDERQLWNAAIAFMKGGAK
jgi:hypothetical protein